MSDLPIPETWRPFVKPETPISSGLVGHPTEVSYAAPTVAKSLVSKLAEVMAAVERVPKHGRNDFHKYDYATEADIAAAIRNELATRGVMLIPAIETITREGVGEKGTILTTIAMLFTFFDGATGEQLVFHWFGCGSDKDDKGLYKAMTGAEKYFLLKTFLIPTGDDPERDETKGKATTTVRAPANVADSHVPTTELPAPSIRVTRPKMPIPLTARAAIPDGCALVLEVQGGQWGKAIGQVLMIDSSGVEGKFPIFTPQLLPICEQACQDGVLIAPEMGTLRTGKPYLKDAKREDGVF